MKMSSSAKVSVLSAMFFILCITAHAQENYISISKGGGITGSATVYKLYSNGDLFKGQGLGDIRFTEKSIVKKCARKKFFQQAEKLSLEPFQHPGNIYYSITYAHQGKTVIVTWGAEGHLPPDGAKKLYEDLFTKIETLKFSLIK
jgi:hypothetical protein